MITEWTEHLNACLSTNFQLIVRFDEIKSQLADFMHGMRRYHRDILPCNDSCHDWGNSLHYVLRYTRNSI